MSPRPVKRRVRIAEPFTVYPPTNRREATIKAADSISLGTVDNRLQEVTVIVVTYESAHCIDALDALLSRCPHVIVVDNGSHDGTPAAAQIRWPHANIIALEHNHGFGAANNLALARVRTPWALLLNPDCLLTPETLARMIGTGETMPDAAIITPQLRDVNGRAEINYRWPITEWASKGPGADGLCCVGFACGAAMLLRMALIPKPAFDERFFLYYEDDDLCLHLFKHRKSIVVLPDCVATHRSRGSVRGTKRLQNEFLRGYHHAQSKLKFIEKHISLERALKTQKKLSASTALSLPFRLILLNPRLLARVWGRWNGIRHWRPTE